jgi:cation-transporting ATPase 13A3/4/5
MAYARPNYLELEEKSDKGKLFENSEDEIENFKKNKDVAILKRFDFEAKLQRMSVVVKNMSDKTFRAYVKGSPEKIAELCITESLP